MRPGLHDCLLFQLRSGSLFNRVSGCQGSLGAQNAEIDQQSEACLVKKAGGMLPAFLDIPAVRNKAKRLVSRVRKIPSLTTMKQTEANRRKSEQTIRALLDSSAEAILAVNQEGRIVFGNRMAGKMFGYTDVNIVGQPLENLIPEEARGPHSVHYRNFFNGPRRPPLGCRREMTALRRDKSRFPVEVSLSVIEEIEEGTNHGGPDSPAPAVQTTLAVAFISDLSERKRLEAATKAYTRQIQALSSRLLTTQEDERRRVSRELHDEICQELAFLSLKLGSLANASPAESTRRALIALQVRASRAAEMTRHIAHNLHPSTLDDLGLVVSMEYLCKEVSKEHGIPISFTHGTLPESVSRETASCFYRIAQQSLQNVVQHAKATHVSVDLAASTGIIALSVEDDGVGFEPEKVRGRGSLGLIGMEERARLVNGRLSIHSQPGKGTKVHVEIPVPATFPPTSDDCCSHLSTNSPRFK